MTNGRGMTRSTIISPRASSYLEACGLIWVAGALRLDAVRERGRLAVRESHAPHGEQRRSGEVTDALERVLPAGEERHQPGAPRGVVSGAGCRPPLLGDACRVMSAIFARS